MHDTSKSVDVDLTLAKRPPRPPLVSSRAAVAAVALERALGAEGRRLLQRGRGEAVFVEVPTPQWIEPVMAEVRARVRKGTLVVTKGKTDELAARLAGGDNVVGVGPSLDLLPRLLVDCVTRRYKVTNPDPDLLRQSMKRCLTGKAPAALASLRLSELDFDLLCALMPTGLSKRSAVERLSRAANPRSTVTQSLTLPRLEDAIEYGDARTWGLDLARDINDLKAGRIGWHQVDRGAIVQGDFGVGKTTFSKVLADACGIPIVQGSISEYFASSAGYLDSVIKAQRRLFAEAAEKSPCVLFIDEIQAMPSISRMTGSRNGDWWMPVVMDFALLLDSAMHRRDGIIVLGATNNIELVDPLLLRKGRLERAIRIGPATPAGLVNLMRTHLAGELEGHDLLPIAIAAETATAAMVMDWVRTARRAARRANRAMTYADLEAQVITPDSRTSDELHRAAIHEAGHALIGQKQGLELVSVSIRRVGGSGGRARFVETSSPVLTSADLAKRVRMTLGGLAAEIVLCGGASTGAGGDETSDLAQATAMVAAMRASYGLSGDLTWKGSPSDAMARMRIDRNLQRSVEADLRRYQEETISMVREFRTEIAALAAELVEARYLQPTGRPVGLIERDARYSDANKRDRVVHVFGHGEPWPRNERSH